MELFEEIAAFLVKYASKRKDEDDEQEYYTSPDAQELENFAERLIQGVSIQEIPFPRSSWGSGGYRPWTDKAGEEWHNQILQKIKRLKENSK